MPFTQVRIGDERIDIALDNLIAYTVVACREHPSADDLTLAQNILPRLETLQFFTMTPHCWIP